MTSNRSEDALKACAVPLVERLLRIPADAILRWTEADGLQASHSVPIGKLAHEAADKLTRSEASAPIIDEGVVERVARVIAVHHGVDPTWSEKPDCDKEHWRGYARAALEASGITALEAENALAAAAFDEIMQEYRQFGAAAIDVMFSIAEDARAALQQPPTIDSLAAKVKRAAEQGPDGRPDLGAMSAEERDAALFQHNGDEG